jgi:hypothetical protein
MEEVWSIRQYYFLNPQERGLYRVQAPHRAGLYSFSRLFIQYVLYSVLVILPRLHCSQVETGLYVAGPLPPYKLPFSIHLY